MTQSDTYSYPYICDNTGVEPVNGICPIHGGDNCIKRSDLALAFTSGTAEYRDPAEFRGILGTHPADPGEYTPPRAAHLGLGQHEQPQPRDVTELCSMAASEVWGEICALRDENERLREFIIGVQMRAKAKGDAPMVTATKVVLDNA